MKNTTIFLSKIRLREEEFGVLVNAAGRFHVINDTGIELINILKENNYKMETDNLLNLFLSKFVFTSEEEYSNAFDKCINYLENLKQRNIIGVVQDV